MQEQEQRLFLVPREHLGNTERKGCDMRTNFEYDSREFWRQRATVRQHIINQLRRELKQANRHIFNLENL